MARILAGGPRSRSAETEQKRAWIKRSLEYLGAERREKMTDIAIDRVFIGSCTNGRIEDLRPRPRSPTATRSASASTPWSYGIRHLVKAQDKGLDKIFLAAGFETRLLDVLAMIPDELEPGERCASTSNRNFEGRQGMGAAVVASRLKWRPRPRSPGASSTCATGDRGMKAGDLLIDESRWSSFVRSSCGRQKHRTRWRAPSNQFERAAQPAKRCCDPADQARRRAPPGRRDRHFRRLRRQPRNSKRMREPA